MAGFIRTDRTAFVAIDEGGAADVDGPRDGVVTVEQRAVSPTEFGELSTLAKGRARRAAALLDNPTPEEIAELQRWHLTSIVTRRSVVRVHGTLLPELRTALDQDPGRIVEFLEPGALAELGALAMRRSMVGESPFAVGSSAP